MNQDQPNTKLYQSYEDCRDCRRKELIDEKLKEDNWIDFNGNREHCENYCKGWDGTSRRCDCQNRRVDWEYDSDNDIIEAIAY